MIYRLIYLLLKPLCLVLYRLKFKGLENIPKQGAFILAPNHKSYLDPILSGILQPRPVSFMGKSELFAFRPFGWFLRKMYAIPIRRGEGDRESFRKALDVLKSGGVICIYPEGTRIRDRNVGDIMEGFAMLAVMAQVPVLPVAFIGTDEVMPDGARLPRFPKIRINIGRLLDATIKEGRTRNEKIASLKQEYEFELRKLYETRE